jgi:hypothetical protein
MPKYHAHFVRSGTGEAETLTANSPEELETMIHGMPYGPRFNSVTYWTTFETDPPPSQGDK